MHFSHFSLTTEMDSSLVPVSFRTWFDFDLNEAIDVYDSIDVHDFIIEVHFVKSRKLSHLCSKIYEKSLN